MRLPPFVACGVILAATQIPLAVAADPAATATGPLEIGSPAPAIDIDEWIHPGTVHPVREFHAFTPGTVYVIEFWATWCPHSREAIPLLSALRRRHGRDVVILAVGADPPEQLRGFLGDDDPDARELAAQAGAYCIVADTDGSVHDSLMTPFLETELPTAFIVGRSGLIEWVGHPLEIEEPLTRVVDGTWDRSAFAVDWTARQMSRRTVDRALVLVAEERIAEAVAGLDAFAANDATVPAAANDMAWTLVLQSVYTRLPDPVLAAAQRAAERCVAREPTNGNFLDTLAHVLAVRGRLDEAIATERRAVEHGGDEADTFRAYLRQLEAGRR